MAFVLSVGVISVSLHINAYRSFWALVHAAKASFCALPEPKSGSKLSRNEAQFCVTRVRVVMNAFGVWNSAPADWIAPVAAVSNRDPESVPVANPTLDADPTTPDFTMNAPDTESNVTVNGVALRSIVALATVWLGVTIYVPVNPWPVPSAVICDPGAMML